MSQSPTMTLRYAHLSREGLPPSALPPSALPVLAAPQDAMLYDDRLACLSPEDPVAQVLFELLQRVGQLQGEVHRLQASPEQPMVYTLDEAVHVALNRFAGVRSMNTMRAYRAHAAGLLAAFGGRAVDSITATELEAWRAAALTNSSPSTVVCRLSFLSLVFQVAMKTGRVGAKPVKEMERGKVNNQRELTIDADQQAWILSYMVKNWPGEPENPLIVRLATLTGMRRMELFGLQRGNVNLKQQVHKDRQVYGLVEIPRAKGDKRRWIPLNREAAGIVAELMSLHAGPYVIRQLWRDKTCRVSMANNWCKERFKPAAKALGLPELRLHDLRHTFASRCIMQANASLAEVKDLLGHAEIGTTMRYLHMTQEHLHGVVQRLDKPTDSGEPTISRRSKVSHRVK